METPSSPRPRHRAQTSKQAKAAYAKRKGPPKISDKELRQMARNDELQARARKIREREEKKSLNARKKAEKEMKQEEKLKRMGVVKQNGPSNSQPKLDIFLRGGKRDGKRGGEDTVDNVDSESGFGARCVGRDERNVPGANFELDVESKQEDIHERSQDNSLKHACDQGLEQENSPAAKRRPETKTRSSLQSIDINRSYQRRSPPSKASWDPPPILNTEETWEDFIASSTQIERELSIPSSPPVLVLPKSEMADEFRASPCLLGLNDTEARNIEIHRDLAPVVPISLSQETEPFLEDEGELKALMLVTAQQLLPATSPAARKQSAEISKYALAVVRPLEPTMESFYGEFPTMSQEPTLYITPEAVEPETRTSVQASNDTRTVAAVLGSSPISRKTKVAASEPSLPESGRENKQPDLVKVKPREENFEVAASSSFYGEISWTDQELLGLAM